MDMAATTNHNTGNAGEGSVPMNAIIATIGSVTVTDRGDDAHHIGCGRCGESVTYRFREFTLVEAQRHEAWCAKHKG
jgi:hypothetical protein